MHRIRNSHSILHAWTWCGFLLVCLVTSGVASAQCDGRWLTSQQQIAPGFDGPVYAYAELPNGDVVAGGLFTSVGGVPVTNIARWNGTTWSAMGSIGRVNALTLDQNGNLLAGVGDDTSSGWGSVLRWNGSSWSEVGNTGMTGGVMAVAVAPNGDIIAGGWFGGMTGPLGEVSASCIARWNGTTWSALGTPYLPNFPRAGLGYPINSSPGAVYAITVLANGDIIAGGQFISGTNATGPVFVQNIARWNGSAWSGFGQGLRGGANTVRALGVLSSGQIVAAGGFFLGTAGFFYSGIATWNGTSWLPIGTGSEDPIAGSTTIYALKTLPGGGVIIGGDFGTWAGLKANRVALWNGSAWSNYASGVDSPVFALMLRNNGDLMVGGAFSAASGSAANRAARWNGSQWSPIASGLGLSDAPTAMVTMPSGDIVAAGRFTAVNGSAINVGTDGSVWPGGVARWNGAAWSPLPPLAPVNTLAVASNGDLIAGGSFGNGVLRLSGSTWTPLPGGGVDGPVNAVVRMPNGDLIIAGSFVNATGVPNANNIARWNGSSFAPLGTGFNAPVLALAVLPNGDLVAAGTFTFAGGSSANRIARWNGSAWSPFGAGLSSTVRALAARPNGDLIAGGQFTGTVSRWTGSAWSSIGPDLFRVFTLAVQPNGDLIAGGVFDMAGGVSANNIARWNGSTWGPLGTGIGAALGADVANNPPVAAIAITPSGEIIAGGAIATAGGTVSNSVARWTDTGTPWVSTAPAPQSLNAGQTLTLSATCASGYDFSGPVNFQWRRNGAPIVNGPAGASSGGGTVANASGPLTSPSFATTLTITDTHPGDAGEYSVTFTNSCGSIASNAATASIASGCPCPADFDGSGGTPDSTDIFAYFSAWLLGDPTADADCSGGTPDSTDINTFFTAWLAGGC